MQSAQAADQLVAGPKKEMVGVTEDDARPEIIPKVVLAEAFDRRLCADRHEDRRRDVAMFGMQDTRAGARNRTFGKQFEGDRAGQRLLYCACAALRP